MRGDIAVTSVEKSKFNSVFQAKTSPNQVQKCTKAHEFKVCANKIHIRISKNNMDKNITAAQDAPQKTMLIPSSIKNAELGIFSARYVRMHGRDYYLRVFSDGSGEFTRFDTESGKWIFLCFPAA